MNLDELRNQPFEGYAYAYPHKTAYRRLEPRRPLHDVWSAEDRSSLTFYVHVPVCEMRCGFCNLFTTIGTSDDFEVAYLDALDRQVEQVRNALGTASFRAAAIGGGTPTFFSLAGLERLLRACERIGASPRTVPTAVETSPRTAEVEKLHLLRQAGVRRISIGVQSFDEAETGTLGRPQRVEWVSEALDRIRAVGPPTLNIDLMYGMPGQTAASLTASIDRALAWQPEEVYLYPLYVRPLTGLGRKGRSAGDHRVGLYRTGRERLLGAGYEQISMRFFRLRGGAVGADHRCQEESTVGVGCGARSYTRTLHYSNAWAVGREAVREILDDYLRTPDEDFRFASYGVEVSPDEQRRRYVLKTLLRREGVPLSDYRTWFGSQAATDLPVLGELVEQGLAAEAEGSLRLSEEGLELSDAIGPLLYSDIARERMSAFELR